MTHPTAEQHAQRPPRWLPLWFGVLGGQAAWALAVLLAYPTVAAVCEAGASTVWIHLVRWAALVVALAATAVASRCWRVGRSAGDDVPVSPWRSLRDRLTRHSRESPPQAPAIPMSAGVAGRVRFMGLGGMILSAAGAFLLVVEDIATWVIHPCL